MVSNPKIKSTLESSAIRTGREKVYFKSFLLNDTTISRTAVDSIHWLLRPEHIHMGESVVRSWGSPCRPRRTLRLITSPTWHPVSIWARAAMPLFWSIAVWGFGWGPFSIAVIFVFVLFRLARIVFAVGVAVATVNAVAKAIRGWGLRKVYLYL